MGRWDRLILAREFKRRGCSGKTIFLNLWCLRSLSCRIILPPLLWSLSADRKGSLLFRIPHTTPPTIHHHFIWLLQHVHCSFSHPHLASRCVYLSTYCLLSLVSYCYTPFRSCGNVVLLPFPLAGPPPEENTAYTPHRRCLLHTEIKYICIILDNGLLAHTSFLLPLPLSSFYQ